MKKFLVALTFTLGTCLAVNAQDTQRSDETPQVNSNVQVQSGGQSVQGTPAQENSVSATEMKNCGSSTKGKESASKGGKSCCADKKSAANCSSKKDKADAGTKKDLE